MATKKSVEKPSFDASRFHKAAKEIAGIVGKIEGIQFEEIQEGLTINNIPRIDKNDLMGEKITVLGFQRRSGKIKGKDTNYAIIFLLAPKNLQGTHNKEMVDVPVDSICSFATGGAVITKKLYEAAVENSFPITGTISERKSAEGVEYNDFN